jgi:mRNA-degrading endonuclease toxin of MazEF toxin-antitoxin module
VETLDKSRLGEKIGEITDSLVMDAITVALQIQIGAFAEYN